MARKHNIIIASTLCDLFEQFVKFNPKREYERFTTGTPLLTRYIVGHLDLLGTVIEIELNYEITCPNDYRQRLLYCIAHDLLDPPTIIEP